MLSRHSLSSKLNLHKECEQALMTTPRRPTNFFNLPSLDLTASKGAERLRLQPYTTPRGGSKSARNRMHESVREGSSAYGSQTAREMAKEDMAKESIVKSLKKRIINSPERLATISDQDGYRTPRNQAPLSTRNRSTLEWQMQLQA